MTIPTVRAPPWASVSSAEKLTAIRYITIQNEPNTTTMTMETYNRLYRALDAELKQRGLRW